MQNNEKKQPKKLSRQEIDLINQFNNIYNSYQDIDITTQIGALKYIFDYVKKCKDSGMTVGETEFQIQNYIELLVNSIESPTLNDFYRLRTIEYISKGKFEIEPYFVNIINRLKENSLNEVTLGEYDLDYSADINKNIELALCEIMEFMAYDIEECLDKDFCNICDKIKDKSLTTDDIPLLKKYSDRAVKHLITGRKNSWEQLVRENPELVYKTISNNLNKILEISTTNSIINKPLSNTNMSMEEFVEKSRQSTPSYFSTTSDSKNNAKKQVKRKKFITNPFIGNDKTNNILIHLNDIMKTTDEENLEVLYELVVLSKNKKHLKKVIVETLGKFKYYENSMKLTPFLRERIERLITFFDETGELEVFNKLNNERLKSIKLDCLSMDTEKIKELLQYDNLSNSASTEMLTAMSAFYTNRLSKVQSKYTIAEFIFKQDNIVEKIYENPDLEFEDLGFTKESVKNNLAKHELLKRIMMQRFSKDLGNEKISEIGTEEGQYLNDQLKASLKKLAGYSKGYEKQFKGNFTDDLLSVYKNYITERKIYALKDYAIYTLMYTTIMDKGNNVVNWGYIKENSNNFNTTDHISDDNIIIGFDVKGLNMSVNPHMGKKKTEGKNLMNFIKTLTGSYQIPVYEGKDDMYVLPSRYRT